MSETVHYIGTANLICKGAEQVENKAIEILDKRNQEVKSYYDNATECLCDYYYEEYFYHPKTERLYEISYTQHGLDEEIIKAKYVGFDNSQIGFELKYYNGSAGFTECLEEAMDKLD